MTGDRDGQTAGKANLLVRAVDGILGSPSIRQLGQLDPGGYREQGAS